MLVRVIFGFRLRAFQIRCGRSSYARRLWQESSNHVIILNRYSLTIRIAYENAVMFFVDSCDFSHDHGCIFLFAQNSADRNSNMTWRQHRGRNLIQQRLKQMVIIPVNYRDICRGLAESLGCKPGRRILLRL